MESISDRNMRKYYSTHVPTFEMCKYACYVLVRGRIFYFCKRSESVGGKGLETKKKSDIYRVIFLHDMGYTGSFLLMINLRQILRPRKLTGVALVYLGYYVTQRISRITCFVDFDCKSCNLAYLFHMHINPFIIIFISYFLFW